MKKFPLIILLLCVIQLFIFSRDSNVINNDILLLCQGKFVSAKDTSVSPNKCSIQDIPKLEIPKTNPNEIIITHVGYSLVYNEQYEQAKWVAYQLTKEETVKSWERGNAFKEDPEVKTMTASNQDYAGSGFDRGHLAPAADMGWSSISMSESFYYSNMSPQNPTFNRGIWKQLEGLVRNWAIENDTLYVVTGPVLTYNLVTIGPNQVAVPDYFFKVILDYSKPVIKGIGFIMANIGSDSPLQNYAVTIDSVEKFTGIDFFPLLPDDEEGKIEEKCCIECWTWIHSNTLNKAPNKADSSVQCSGITKKGARCKNMTNSPNGRCYQHGGN